MEGMWWSRLMEKKNSFEEDIGNTFVDGKEKGSKIMSKMRK